MRSKQVQAEWEQRISGEWSKSVRLPGWVISGSNSCQSLCLLSVLCYNINHIFLGTSAFGIHRSHLPASADAETPILWPLDSKNWLTGKDPNAGKDWRQEKKGTTEDEMVGWHHQTWHAAVYGVAKSRTWLSDWTELNWGILCDTSFIVKNFKCSFLRGNVYFLC